MRLRGRSFLVGLIGLAVAAGACSRSEPVRVVSSSGGAAALEGWWEVVELHGQAIPPRGVPRPLWLHLEPGTGKLSGYDGCNRHRGTYQRLGNLVAVQPGSKTQKGCPDRAVSLDSEYYEALAAVVLWEVRGDALLLSDPGRVRVRLRRIPPVPPPRIH